MRVEYIQAQCTLQRQFYRGRYHTGIIQYEATDANYMSLSHQHELPTLQSVRHTHTQSATLTHTHLIFR